MDRYDINWGSLMTTVPTPPYSASDAMLFGEENGLACDFPTLTATVKDVATPANNFSGRARDLLTYTAPSPKLVWNLGKLGYAIHNLVLRSQEFNDATAWVKAGTAVTADTTAAPDGTTTADSLADTTANATHDIHPGTGITLAAAPHHMSVYLKKGTHTKAHVSLASSGLGYGVGVNVDLDAGTIGSPVNYGAATDGSAAIEALANGWYRVTVSMTANAGTYYTTIWTTDASFNRTYLGTGTQFYVWGMQLQRLPCHDPAYLPTTTAVRYGLPLDRNPLTDAALGILVEEARTNLITYSQDLANAAWVKSNATVVVDTAIAPTGLMTADKLVENTVNSTHTVYNLAASQAINTFTVSVFVKAAGRTKFRFAQGVTEGFGCDYDLVAKTATPQPGTPPLRYGIQELPDGWFFCWFTYTTTSAHGLSVAIYLIDATGNVTYTGDGVSGMYFWGFQLEVGGFPSSYIQTVAAQVTRAADQISLVVTKFPYSATAGSMLGAYRAGPGTGTACVLSINNSSPERVELFHDPASTSADNRILANVVAGGVTVATLVLDAAGDQNTAHRMAMAWQVDDFAACLDGEPVQTDTSGAVPTGLVKLAIGYNSINVGQLGGHLKEALYLPRRVTNAELQAKTT